MTDFSDQLQRFQFQSTLKELFTAVASQGWKVKVILWNPQNGEEWEATPVGSKQLKRPTQKIKMSVAEVAEPSDAISEGGL